MTPWPAQSTFTVQQLGLKCYTARETRESRQTPELTCTPAAAVAATVVTTAGFYDPIRCPVEV